MSGIFDEGLERNAANYAPLTPVSFVERSAEIFGDLTSVIHGARRYDWAATRDRSARLAAALRALGVGRGTTVSVDARPTRPRCSRRTMRCRRSARCIHAAQHAPRRRGSSPGR